MKAHPLVLISILEQIQTISDSLGQSTDLRSEKEVQHLKFAKETETKSVQQIMEDLLDSLWDTYKLLS
jgi:hypothetical protein